MTRRLARWLGGALALGALGVIAFYRAVVSPMLGGRCRFYPSCSEYAAESIRHLGLLRGGARAALRICRCHPFHPGGFDPPIVRK